MRVNDNAAEWFSGSAAQVSAFLSKFDWGNCVAIAHNSMFDMAILSWKFGIRPKRIGDTLSMARALHGTEVGGSLKALAEFYEVGVKGTEVIQALGKRREDFTARELAEYGEYCVNDVNLTAAIFLRMVPRLPVVENRLIDLTTRMFTEPVLRVDGALLEHHLVDVRERKEKLLADAGIDKSTLMSNQQLAAVLSARGVAVPMKKSPATGKSTYAFAKSDKEFLALAEHENPEIQAIVSARLGVKSTLEETRTERYIQIAKRGSLPIPLRYYAAHTGRWGGDDKVNFQNLPRKSVLKNAILPPEGHVIINCDSSQIEARIVAWLAGQRDLLDAFERGEDTYKIMATKIYGTHISAVSEKQRFVGKTTILGCGYGMGAERFRDQLKNFGVDISMQEAEYIVQAYRNAYPLIRALWSKAGMLLVAIARDVSARLGPVEETIPAVVADGRDGLLLPNGMHIAYPGLRKVTDTEPDQYGRDNGYVYDTKKYKFGKPVPTKIYGGKVIENVCQALARIIIGDQMLAIAKRYKVVMTVHDAVTCVVRAEEADEALDYIRKCMRERPRWATTLPLDCKGGIGPSYGECKEV